MLLCLLLCHHADFVDILMAGGYSSGTFDVLFLNKLKECYFFFPGDVPPVRLLGKCMLSVSSARF